MNRLDRAIMEAVSVHAGQVDKLGYPYIFHPLAVLLAAKDESEEVQIVSVLHDIFEESPDPEYTRHMIGRIFGDRIVEALDAITHLDNEPYEDYIRRCMKDPIAHKAKILDVLNNVGRLKGLPEKDQVRLRAKYRGALNIL